MKIYDSLTNKTFDLINKKLSIYNCGPTVYNDVHIGNIRPLITFDVLVRFLKNQKFDITYIHNITDIDDKIINKAKEEKKTEMEISSFYTNHYLEIVKQLNALPMLMPKVSENINGIIEYINKLVQNNGAYVTNEGNVYFDVNKVSNYGTLSHQNINQLIEGSRKELASDKKFPLDFALWKKTETGLNWKSPWSIGRPGWHTECAYFISKLVGDHVTIHGGGIDLKFPHHENENAQNNAIFHRNIADLWMHVGHINVNNEKMAKSLGNFVLVKDLLIKYTPNDLRWFMYQTKYENPLNYSEDLINQSSNDLLKLFQQLNQGYVQMILNDVAPLNNKNNIDEKFVQSLDDDLNFPEAVAVLWKQAKGLTHLYRSKKWNEFQNEADVIKKELNIFGIVYKSPLEDSNIHSLVIEYKKALNEKNYIVSDKYRQQLIDMKVING
ncbi:MAG: cysteine--tRNA ligase [Mycoplasmataceae bacterium]|nr:cysteine--tRNA ligase [Mycoplasmataceae bacterium]